MLPRPKKFPPESFRDGKADEAVALCTKRRSKPQVMRLRHAAALALVSWYLMTPPAGEPPTYTPDGKAPLSEWSIIGSYSSAKECGDDHQHKVNRRYTDRAMATMVLFAECISTDDPRLAK
jgi:hypothetical protein